MKKFICIILIICFLPIRVNATQTFDAGEYFEQQIVTDVVWTVVASVVFYKFYTSYKAGVKAAKIKAGKAKNIAKYNKQKKLKEKEMKLLEEKILQMIKNPTP